MADLNRPTLQEYWSSKYVPPFRDQDLTPDPETFETFCSILRDQDLTLSINDFNKTFCLIVCFFFSNIGAFIQIGFYSLWIFNGGMAYGSVWNDKPKEAFVMEVQPAIPVDKDGGPQSGPSTNRWPSADFCKICSKNSKKVQCVTLRPHLDKKNQKLSSKKWRFVKWAPIIGMTGYGGYKLYQSLSQPKVSQEVFTAIRDTLLHQKFSEAVNPELVQWQLTPYFQQGFVDFLNSSQNRTERSHRIETMENHSQALMMKIFF
uniref:Uncharacterized protein n=1 Tax=Boodleopsis pusilla TaxID=381415 RepID=A0A386AZF5_9CHLO|nr:hypothetical protein [Boodleopsis pusilla]AYC64830.1 hypothetical protein [Boodleopsis pusilla]